MWISKRKWDEINKRISALERAEQERIDEAKYREEHGDEALEVARKLLMGR